MNEKLEMAKNSLYNANEIKDIKENQFCTSKRGSAKVGNDR